MRWRQHHRSVSLAALALAAAMVPGALVAQDGTPASAERVPAPEDCRVEPRPADEFAALTGLNGEPPAASAPVQIPVPLGRPANRELSDALDRTAREFLSCMNAGDLLRQAALFTDAGVSSVFGPAPTEPAAVDAIRATLAAAPEARSEEARRRFVALANPSRLEEGRAGAFLVFIDPANPPRGAEELYLAFVQEGDRWLIDGVIQFTAVRDAREGTPAATPAP